MTARADVEEVVMQAAEDFSFTPEEWESQVGDAAAMAARQGLPPTEFQEVAVEMRVADQANVQWVHDGSAWYRWDRKAWSPGRPVGALRLVPFTMHWLVSPAEEELPVQLRSPAPGREEMWAATHAVPEGGLQVWSDPDPSTEAREEIGGGVQVQLVERRGDWARVVAENGWWGWVDARGLEELAAEPTPPAETTPAESSEPTEAIPPPNWYPDPSGEARLRYWDGTSWTEETAD